MNVDCETEEEHRVPNIDSPLSSPEPTQEGLMAWLDRHNTIDEDQDAKDFVNEDQGFQSSLDFSLGSVALDESAPAQRKNSLDPFAESLPLDDEPGQSRRKMKRFIVSGSPNGLMILYLVLEDVGAALALFVRRAGVWVSGAT